MKRKYGWQPDVPDMRDKKFLPKVMRLPNKVDLRKQCSEVYDQGQLGSCTANAIAAAVDFERKKQGEEFIDPSRLFIYYNERVIEDSVNEDAGAEIRDGIKTVAAQGVVPEKEWPYEVSEFRTHPPKKVYDDALGFQTLEYKRIDNRNLIDIQSALAEGLPVVFGFAVYESFESQEVAERGKVPMPKKHEQMLGGHAVLAVGYDLKKKRFIARNSWGEGWGDKGYFTIPFAYLTDTNLADDFWVISKVE